MKNIINSIEAKSNMKIRTLVLLTAAFGFLASPLMALADKKSADRIFHNGKIYTVDTDLSWAQALAIKDGKFIKVGKNTDMAALTGANTQVIDLQGKLVLPGFHAVNSLTLSNAEHSNPTIVQCMDLARKNISNLNSLGITSMVETHSTPVELAALNRLNKDDSLNARVMNASKTLASLTKGTEGNHNPFFIMGQALTTNQNLTVNSLIAKFTIEAAGLMSQQKNNGSIAKGKWADMIVVDRNILTSPISDLLNAKVLLTIFNGKPVYHAETSPMLAGSEKLDRPAWWR